MAIQYCIVERENPQDRTAPKKFYASAMKRGSMGIDGLAERIADATTASRADTLLVLTALCTQLDQLLSEGYSVKLQGLGTFRVTLNGIGADTMEEFGPHLIRKPSIRFLPEVALKERVKRASLEKVSRPKVDAGGGGTSPEPGPGES
ncbi:MAG: HU family DNA-binding protein [Bacteroidales bacterium]